MSDNMLIVTIDKASDTAATFTFGEQQYHCVIGKAGAKSAEDKQEGDNATPLGIYHIVRGFYRADRLEKPITKGLELLPVSPDMGWENNPNSECYNQWVKSGYSKALDESFWREDELYNIILVLDHNGAWPYETERPKGVNTTAGKGSAIFMHVMKLDEYNKPKPTAGCVALQQNDLLQVLAQLEDSHTIQIKMG